MKIEYLYHYYEKQKGPFLNLSRLEIDEAKSIQNKILKNEKVFASERPDDYLERRKELEHIAYTIFVKKGGRPQKKYPHYMVVEECKWLETWYKTPAFIKIPIQIFDMNKVSFSYGDLFPAFSDSLNNKEYSNQIYTYTEILEIVKKYGLPQEWNTDGKYGPERYIEAQIWDNGLIEKYIHYKEQK